MANMKVTGPFGTYSIPISTKNDKRIVDKVNNSTIVHKKEEKDSNNSSSKNNSSKKELEEFVEYEENTTNFKNPIFCIYDKNAKIRFMEEPHILDVFI